ncbi:hypothetical protein M413DRAFT_354147 [Hebeloma cylindrosporum]|uniref:Uncharacterized protein n=1 Tax=Hebeloma cylindrosporum TaxID=76867 RepID=A0A0C3CL14_HEBCY|nr:hypothetical protein M413DRAFT_354147 [Hebeloma cylindrosporum h7]
MFHDIFTMHQVMSHKGELPSFTRNEAYSSSLISEGVLTFAQISQERGRQYPWHQRLWLWIIRHHMVHGGIIFKKLFLQGQFHFKTNDALRQMIEGDLEDE